ncbi:MAG: CarD family transcriptional regulator [Bacillota bacterium]|jgi:CarD family transcriptional regulator
MFAVGDKVVHPIHGAGIIEGIEAKEFLGKLKDYFILRIPSCNMKIMIPCDGADATGIRSIISKDDCKKVFQVLRDGIVNEELSKEMPGSKWNYRHRILMEKIKGGNVYDLADIVRVLSLRNSEKPLSGGEKRVLDQARTILASELSLVGEITTEAAEEKINDTLLLKAE